jgi:hypothetical protein
MPSEKRHALNWSESYHINRIISNCIALVTPPPFAVQHTRRAILSCDESAPLHASLPKEALGYYSHHQPSITCSRQVRLDS